MRPVSAVRIPLGLRTDLATATGDGVALLDALDRGVQRAVVHVEGTLVQMMSGGTDLRPGEVTFRWIGEGHEHVSPAARRKLEQGLERGIEEAVRAGLARARAHRFSGHGTDRWAGEGTDANRWTEAGDYLVPSYDDDGNTIPVTVHTPPSPLPSTYQEVLYPFTSYEEVELAIRHFFPNPAPRGGRYYGVYGQWAITGVPTLFWLKEGTGKGPSFIRTQSFVAVQVWNGQIVGSNVPIGYVGGRIYRLRLLPKAKQRDGLDYWFERVERDGTKPIPAFLNHLKEELQGWEIHFGVAVMRQETIEVAGVAPPGVDKEGIPPWQFWGVSNLGWFPDNGVSDGAWAWCGWLNIQPAELRRDPIVKQILEKWGTSKEDLNLLFLYLHANEFYREMCRYVALEMLAESRKNMEDFLSLMQQPNHPWAEQFDTVVRYLAPSGEQAAYMEVGQEWEYERTLGTLRQVTEYRERLYQQQEASMAEFGHGLPGGIIHPGELEQLRTEIARIESERESAGTELPKAHATFQAAEMLEPLLVVLTIQGGKSICSLSQALARYAPRGSGRGGPPYESIGYSRWDPARSDDAPSAWIRREFGTLINNTRQAERDINDNPDKVYQLGLVRQVVDRRIKGWLDANPTYAESVRKMIEGPGILFWLGIGVALVVITFACPPLGAGLAAGIGGYQAVVSISNYRRVERHSRVRIAQYGFVPLASASEVSGALLSAILDTVFFFFDVKGLGHSIARAGRSAAREAAEGFGRGMERLLAGVRNLDSWPTDLTDAITREIDQLVKSGLAPVGHTVDDLVKAAKAEMALRYERHVFQVKEELAVLLEKPGLTGKELQSWLTQRVRSPLDFLDDLAKRELKVGEELWEGVVGKVRSGVKPQVLGATFEFLPRMSREAELALRTELGDLAGLLTPDRLLQLGLISQIQYPDLARRLAVMLRRGDNPARSLDQLENLLRGRGNAPAILQALETQARPGILLEHLSPDLLDATRRLISPQELLEAMSRATDAGTIERFYLHTRVGGEVALARDIVGKDGRLMIQRWSRDRGWQIYRRWGPRPQPTVGAAARRAAEQSTLASVVEGSEKASRGLARLSTDGRRVLLEELEDTVLDPELARRLLEAVDDLPERSIDALVAIQRAEQASGGLGFKSWIDILEHSRGWRDDLLRLVGEIQDLVDGGLAEAVRRGMTGGTNIQGSLGHLHAAVTCRQLFPGGRMRFEVPEIGREIDIVVEHQGRRIDVEVKTDLAGTPSINTGQMRNDLRRHAADGGQNLLYLYHTSVGQAGLDQVREAMRQEARSVLTAAQAREVENRLDQIVQFFEVN